jgi:hypothetical protein
MKSEILLLLAILLLTACGKREELAPAPPSFDGVAGYALIAFDHPRTLEVFACDGGWRFRDPGQHHNNDYITHTARTDEGSYTFEDGTLCVTPSEGERRCRSLRQNAQGQIVEIDAGGAETDRRYQRMLVGGVGSCSPSRLTTEQIQEVLPGASVEFEVVAHDGASRWDFQCDGTWRSTGGQPSVIEGRYTIENDTYCIGITQEPFCTALYRAESGAYFRGAEVRKAGEPGELIVGIPLVPPERRC